MNTLHSPSKADPAPMFVSRSDYVEFCDNLMEIRQLSSFLHASVVALFESGGELDSDAVNGLRLAQGNLKQGYERLDESLSALLGSE